MIEESPCRNCDEEDISCRDTCKKLAEYQLKHIGDNAYEGDETMPYQGDKGLLDYL